MDTKGAGVRGGGSALKRLKSDLKSAGVLGGPKAKRRKTNNNNDAAGNKLRAFERKEKLTKLKGENPFELKFAKQKHDVLGKKTSAVSGRPGAMKIKAEEKVGRKETHVRFHLSWERFLTRSFLGFVLSLSTEDQIFVAGAQEGKARVSICGPSFRRKQPKAFS